MNHSTVATLAALDVLPRATFSYTDAGQYERALHALAAMGVEPENVRRLECGLGMFETFDVPGAYVCGPIGVFMLSDPDGDRVSLTDEGRNAIADLSDPDERAAFDSATAYRDGDPYDEAVA